MKEAAEANETENAVPLTIEEFNFIHNTFMRWGWEEITKKDRSRDYFRLKYSTDKKIIGREVGYRYSRNHLTCKSWTSFDRERNQWREKGTDAMWPIIVEGDDLVYCPRMILRSQNAV